MIRAKEKNRTRLGAKEPWGCGKGRWSGTLTLELRPEGSEEAEHRVLQEECSRWGTAKAKALREK